MSASAFARCAYADCGRDPGPPAAGRGCRSCRRPLRRCASCQAANRRLARFCRCCGRPLADHLEDWTAFRGGGEKRSLSRHVGGALSALAPVTAASFRLDEACASLLFYDGFLIAISAAGQICTLDLAEPRRQFSFATQIALRAQPCIDRGRLYLAGEGGLAAYGLSQLDQPAPRLESCWSVPLEGIPQHSLLCSGKNLFLVQLRADGQAALTVVEGLAEKPAFARSLAAAERLSGLVAAPGRPVAVLGSRHGKVHLLKAAGEKEVGVTERILERLPGDFGVHVPLVAVGKKLFAIFGEQERLCRLDDETGFELVLRDDVSSFALAGLAEGVAIDSEGLYFLRTGSREPLPPGLRIVGQPLILRDCAAVVGLNDGRLRLYDLANPPFFAELRLGEDASEAVSVLAAAGEYLAAGGSSGSVRLFHLSSKGAGQPPEGRR